MSTLARRPHFGTPGHPARLAGALLLGLLALVGVPAQAQESSRAGLVIVHGDGRVVKQCVSFDEDSVNGYELLKRSGLNLKVEAGGAGTSICAVDGEGCAFPQENCFCQCQGSPCVYWSYWQLTENGWQYRNLGAAYTQVRDGAVEGWHWSAGTLNDAPEPPDVTFAEICPAGPTTAKLAVAATGAATVAPTQHLTATQPAAVATIPALPSMEQPEVQPAPSLAVLGAVVLVLVVVPAAGAAVLLMRRARRQDK